MDGTSNTLRSASFFVAAKRPPLGLSLFVHYRYGARIPNVGNLCFMVPPAEHGGGHDQPNASKNQLMIRGSLNAVLLLSHRRFPLQPWRAYLPFLAEAVI
jgi:hypothetical protein